VFVVTSIFFVGNSLIASPVDSLIGLGLVALGVPAYVWWRRNRVADVAALSTAANILMVEARAPGLSTKAPSPTKP
jgi:hypothetical protein